MKFGRWSERLSISRALLLTLILVNAPVVVGQQATPKLRDGVTLVIELRQSLRGDRAKTGDQVRAKLLSPVLQNGAVILPAGTTVLGVVSENQALAPPLPSRLLIRFQQAQWKQTTIDLNAYIVRHLVFSRKFSYRSREFCPPVQRFLPHSQFQPTGQQTGQAQAPPPPPEPPPRQGGSRDDDACHSTGAPIEEMPLVFTTPRTTDIVLRKLDSPVGATALESNSKNISLPKGTIFEIRHTASEANPSPDGG